MIVSECPLGMNGSRDRLRAPMVTNGWLSIWTINNRSRDVFCVFISFVVGSRSPMYVTVFVLKVDAGASLVLLTGKWNLQAHS